MPVSINLLVETLNQHRIDLTGYAWVVVGDPQLADDVFQDVSLVAIEKVSEIQNEQHVLPWLRNAIRLRGLEVRRNRGRRASLLSPELLELIEAASAEASDRESDQMESLRHCVESLPAKSRDLLSLRYAHDLKPGEIALQTGKSDVAVYKMFSRIHILLRDCVARRLKTLGGKR